MFERAPASGEIRLPKGTVLFRQGDPGDRFFVIHEGRVRLSLGSGAEAREIGVLGPGEFFGEISLLAGIDRSATAEVIDDSRLLVLERDAFGMLLRDDLTTVRRMLSAQCVRLSRTNRPIQRGMHRLARVRVIAHVLRDCGPAMRMPWRTSLEALAADLQLTVDGLAPMVAELAAQGAGTLVAGTWDLTTTAHIDRLIAALIAYSEENAVQGSSLDPLVS